jgi:hypothetical protein
MPDPGREPSIGKTGVFLPVRFGAAMVKRGHLASGRTWQSRRLH